MNEARKNLFVSETTGFVLSFDIFHVNIFIELNILWVLKDLWILSKMLTLAGKGEGVKTQAFSRISSTWKNLAMSDVGETNHHTTHWFSSYEPTSRSARKQKKMSLLMWSYLLLDLHLLAQWLRNIFGKPPVKSAILIVSSLKPGC